MVNHKLGYYRIYLSLAILSGIWWMEVGLNSSTGLTQFNLAELSLARLGISTIFLILLLGFGITLVQTWYHRSRVEKRLISWQEAIQAPRRQAIVYVLTSAALITSLIITFSAPEIEEVFARVIFLRITPFASWIAFLSFETLIGLFILNGVSLRKISAQKSFWLALFIMAGIFITWSTFARRYIPELINRAGWNPLGVPIVEWQVIISWLAGIVFFGLVTLLVHRMQQKPVSTRLNARWLDLGISILIWLLAVGVWQSVEITPSWFISSPLPPNKEMYPYSDARLYDSTAQDALVGGGFRFFQSVYVRRPLHAFYLFILHSLVNQNYQKLVFVQILVIALLPVLLYYLLKAYHNRMSGIVAALMVIMREANSIALAGTITASHVKLLMADLITSLFIVTFTLICFRWLKDIENPGSLGLGIGGGLGLAMLVRLETVVFIPIVLLTLFVLLIPKKLFRLFFRQAFTFMLGIVLVITPWVLRNWMKTGELFIDSPGHRQSLVFERFKLWTLPPSALPTSSSVFPSPSPTTVPEIPVEEPGSASQPTPSVPLANLQNSELSFDPQSLQGLATYFAVHYLNSQVQFFLVLPSTVRSFDSLVSLTGHRTPSRFWADCCSLKNYVRRLPFWHKWLGALPRQSIVPLALNSILLAIGISLMWKQHRWIGLLPVGMFMAYITANAIYRNSGGRYLLPVDWVSIMYFSIGLVSVSLFIGNKYFGDKIDLNHETRAIYFQEKPNSESGDKPIPGIVWMATCILVVVLIPLVEALMPSRYSGERQEEMLTALMGSAQLSAAQKSDIEGYLENGAEATAGRMLYPQYFREGYGAPGYENGPLSPEPYLRLVFFLAGKNSSDLVLPVKDKTIPAPNAADVLVIHCPVEYPDFPDVIALAIFNSSEAVENIIFRYPFPDHVTCPLEERGKD